MATQRNSLRRSRSAISLIPRITISRCSGDQLRRSTSSTNLRASNTDGGPSSSVGRFSKVPMTPLTGNQRTPSRHSSAVKDTRPITDKKWQNDQYFKVKNFFIDYPLVVNNLKPLTIQSFVDAVNILFARIDDRITITAKNYKDSVPSYMKLLRYPATISQSLLKCVNTLHSWPQVIALLSWLVDFINNVCDSPVIVEHIREGSELHEPIENYLFERYVTWLKGENEEDVDRKFQIKLCELSGLNEKDYLKLKNEVENLEVEYVKYLQEDKELNERLTALKQEIQTKKEVIYAFGKQEKVSVDEKCQQMLKQIEDTDKAIVEKRNRIEELKEIISKQPCTVEELEERKRDIEAMKYNLQLQNEKIEKWIEIISSRDHELTDTKRKLDRAVFEQNLEVMKWEHLNPLMKNLELQVTGYAQIKDEVDRVSKLRDEYYQKFVNDLNESKKKLEDTTATYKLFKKKYESIKDELEKGKQISEQLDTEIDLYEQQSEQDTKALLKDKDKLEDEYTSLLKKETELTKEFDALQSEIVHAEENLKFEVENRQELQKNVLSFFVQLQNSIMNNFMKLEEKNTEIKETLMELMHRKIDEQLHVREDLKKMYNLNG